MIRRAVISLLAFSFLFLTGTLWAGNHYVEGKDYVAISPQQPTKDPTKIEVVELFWYGCPHCYQLEPHIEKWLKAKPDDVDLVLQPAIFNRADWQVHAGAFYTAEALGITDKMHPLIFDAIHKEGKPLKDVDSLASFFAKHGTSKGAFKENYNSFIVRSKVRRAVSMTKRYQINGVPNVVVNGKYRTDGPMARTYENLIEIIDFLIERERKLLSPAS